MKLYSSREVTSGDLLPISLFWLVWDRVIVRREFINIEKLHCGTLYQVIQVNVDADITVAGINIPIPVPFWHYRLEFDAPRYGLWMLTLAIRRDDRPIRDGFLPRIEAGCWLSWRKPLSPLITKMLKALPFGNVRNCIQSCENTFTTSQTVATGASEKPPE